MVANINEGLWEEGFYTNVNENFYTITYVGDSTNPTIRLIPAGVIPTEEKITAQFGTTYIGLDFYRSQAGEITKNTLSVSTTRYIILPRRHKCK